MTQVATGTTVTFATSSFTANIESVSWGGVERSSIATSHLGTTTARTFEPGKLYDPGELTLEIHFDPDTQPPITADAETITVEFPNGDTMAASGFITSYEVTAATEEYTTGTISVKFTGAITHTAAI